MKKNTLNLLIFIVLAYMAYVNRGKVKALDDFFMLLGAKPMSPENLNPLPLDVLPPAPEQPSVSAPNATPAAVVEAVQAAATVAAQTQRPVKMQMLPMNQWPGHGDTPAEPPITVGYLNRLDRANYEAQLAREKLEPRPVESAIARYF